ncbi:MAG: Ig-like domain-containing protein [Bacteroidota bacterium]
MIQRFLGFLFLILIVLASLQCARRGNPTGGPKDVTPPQLVKADPVNKTINFSGKTIKLYFDEYVKLEDIQNQLIVSPPLKYLPQITPQGSASKSIEITLKDTLMENTTYTLNFGQSIVDNNEGNPNSFLTYVFSTGDYIDSLSVSGVVKDAFNRNADTFISVMLYEMDSTYTDSTIYNYPPNYITNTLDSTTIFQLENLKAGKYAIIAVKDQAKNNVFDQLTDKIAFLQDTVSLPTDSIYLLTLFKEIPDYNIAVPSFAAKNRIIFGYSGRSEHIDIVPLTTIPDTVKTVIAKEPEKDTLNYWFTPFEADSIVFKISNEKEESMDTFTVKTRKLAVDSLLLTTNQRSSLGFEETFQISANVPIIRIDTSKIDLINKDSIPVNFSARLDSIKNRLEIDFDIEPNENYGLNLYSGVLTDFFENQNDTLQYKFSTGSYADYGNLRLNLSGNVTYPVIVQLTNERGETIEREIYATTPGPLEFNNLTPSKYLIRVINDSNENGKWDTGNYLKKIQPERVSYYPDVLEVRANWELEQTFILSN